jgi:hypothetical protein
MATLVKQDMTRAGVTPTWNNAAASDQFLNDGKTYLHVKNGGGTQDIVTISAVKTCKYGENHDISVTVPMTTGEKIIGPFPANIFNDSNGYVTVKHSFTTSVTVALISFLNG